MAYFRNFGNIWYDLPSGERVLIPDITKFVSIAQKYKSDPRYYISYEIDPHDRPEILCHRLYDSVDFIWTIFLMNDIYDFEEQWPRTDEQLELYLAKKYRGKDVHREVHHYIDTDGLVTNIVSIKAKYNAYELSTNELVAKYNLTPVTVYEHEEELNDEKKHIKLIDPSAIGFVAARLEELLNE